MIGSMMPAPLHYCTNVHPCRSAADLPALLDTYAVEVREECGFPIGVGLWLPAAALADLQATPAGTARLATALAERGLVCHTLNAFPHGDFHGQSVKDRVYRPDWSDPTRLDYTLACGELLAGLLPDTAVGSISTLPLGFKGHPHGAGFEAAALDRLVDLAVAWARLREQTGRTIRLAIEPEPFCLIETTAEAIAFFTRLLQAAAVRGAERAVREHVGLCYDVCHQAVEFEDAAEAIGRLTAAGIRINKVQVSCAIELDHPADPAAREALARFAEPRYLHQTFARTSSGRILSIADLTAAHALQPPREWQESPAWRVHFHVPVDAERIGPLGTTRGELRRALAAIGRLAEMPHLEVETYTWPVMPDAEGAPAGGGGIVAGLVRELVATRELLGPGAPWSAAGGP
jgi:sugar phosphate isomerase/epimerase